MTRYADIADFSLHVHISATFLLPAEVPVTDSESQTPIYCSSNFFSFNSDYGSSIWLSFRDMGMGHTDDRRQTNNSIA